MSSEITHGKRSNYTSGKCREECCRAADREYKRERRRKNRQSLVKEREYSLARARATQRLSQEYPDRYQVLLAEERSRLRETAQPRTVQRASTRKTVASKRSSRRKKMTAKISGQV